MSRNAFTLVATLALAPQLAFASSPPSPYVGQEERVQHEFLDVQRGVLYGPDRRTRQMDLRRGTPVDSASRPTRDGLTPEQRSREFIGIGTDVR